MKTYDEITKDVLTKRDEHEAAVKARRSKLTKGAAVMCAALVVVGGAATATVMMQTDAPVVPADSHKEVTTETTTPLTADDKAFDIANTADAVPTEAAPSAPADTSESQEGAIWMLREGEEPPILMTLISSYDAEECMAIPENGQLFFSPALNGAVTEYGSEVIYHVIVEIYKDGKLLADKQSLMAECDRLAALGYMSMFNTMTDPTGESYSVGFAGTADQVKEFTTGGIGNGYLLKLSDE